MQFTRTYDSKFDIGDIVVHKEKLSRCKIIDMDVVNTTTEVMFNYLVEYENKERLWRSENYLYPYEKE